MKRYLGRAIPMVLFAIAAFAAGSLSTASSQPRRLVMQCPPHFQKVGEVAGSHYRCMLEYTATCRPGYRLAYAPNMSRTGGYNFRVLYGCRKA